MAKSRADVFRCGSAQGARGVLSGHRSGNRSHLALGNHRRLVAALAALSLLVDPWTPLMAPAPFEHQAARQAAKPATTPATQPAAQPAKPTTPGAKPASATTPAAAAPPVDGGWPRSYVLPSGGSILMYQPQISSWDNQA